MLKGQKDRLKTKERPDEERVIPEDKVIDPQFMEKVREKAKEKGPDEALDELPQEPAEGSWEAKLAEPMNAPFIGSDSAVGQKFTQEMKNTEEFAKAKKAGGRECRVEAAGAELLNPRTPRVCVSGWPIA